MNEKSEKVIQDECMDGSVNENNATATDNGSKVNATSKTTLADSIIATIAKSVSELAEKKAARSEVEQKMTAILGTIFTMNSVDEYAIGLRVDGTLYRFSDYSVPVGFNDLLVGKRVVLNEVPTAKDFLKRDMYKVTSPVLDPGQFEAYLRVVMKSLRVNDKMQPLSKSSSVSLAEASKYACDSRKVEDRENTKLYFLSAKFDDEKQVDVDDWAKVMALKLFSNGQ